MERKGIAVVTTEVVARGLAQGATTAHEEQALRMRYGAKVEPGAALPQHAAPGSELGDELLLLEMRLLASLKRRAAEAKRGQTATARAGAKSKIVAQLKKKR